MEGRDRGGGGVVISKQHQHKNNMSNCVQMNADSHIKYVTSMT